jgi:hypothetical protein
MLLLPDHIDLHAHDYNTKTKEISHSTKQSRVIAHDRTLSDDPLASIRDTTGVTLLKGLMTLVLCTKSISQWHFPLIDRTIRYFTA